MRAACIGIDPELATLGIAAGIVYLSLNVPTAAAVVPAGILPGYDKPAVLKGCNGRVVLMARRIGINPEFTAVYVAVRTKALTVDTLSLIHI